ncbi:MAG: serine/threonine protein kinase [Candidatus Dormibacteria bacterium]
MTVPEGPAAHPRGTMITDDLMSLGRLNRGKRTDVYAVWSRERWCLLIMKELREEYSGVRRHARALSEEARLLSEMKHPNLVTVYGLLPGSPPRMLMEPVVGPNLWLKLHRMRRPLPVAQALSTILHAASAVRYMHQLGLLHLDIKPANIICPDAGFAKLVDVGISHRIDRVWDRPERGGTKGYAAPEQTGSHLGPQGPATDVFGLASTLYYSLGRQVPFPSHRDFDQKDLPQLSGPEQSLRELRGEVSARLERVIVRALSPRYSDRHATMDEFMADLYRCSVRGSRLWPREVAFGSGEPRRTGS